MGAYKLPAYIRATHVSGDFSKILLFPRNENISKLQHFYCCCIAYLFSSHSTALDANYWTFRTLSFIVTRNYFVLRGICTCCRVSSFPMSRKFRFLATKFVACSKPQAEIIIVKRPFQERNNVTTVWVEHRLCN